ncbi:GerAB/ArcD/ProY family transporter [Paracerasibacillus soli]|uniref:GerAB/ArcD/ProY family transporter n=1 Tax=Paracerasibacillus soli TaxID=480284 RepID=A0ABU5CQQ0_9BACI|nr:GerAB/ArcD/ProY family transporter [Virgibacillus soli]MDY0407783.1 GerAB/ArcD/ProY family transporter [Virgibacillus soli]
MDVNLTVNKNATIRASYIFFIMATVQLGVGILGGPAYVFQVVKQDAWLSIIIATVAIMLNLTIMFFILKQYKNADIFGIHIDIFGKWLGKLIGSIYIAYFMLSIISVLLTYLEVVNIFLYPTLSPFIIGLLIITLIVYSVSGGLRATVGTCVIFFFLTQGVLLFLYDPIQRIEWDHFFPCFKPPFQKLLKGAQKSTYTLLGFEFILLIYPFIDNKKHIKLPTYLGVLYSSIITLASAVIIIGYFSLKRVTVVEWPFLTAFKSVSLPFAERLDFIVVMLWMMVVLPTCVLLTWMISQGLHRVFAINLKMAVYGVSIILLLIVSFLKYDYIILKVTDYVAKIGFWLIFVYPFILLPIVLLKNKIRGNKK